MFRPVRRKNKEISRAAAMKLLSRERRGIIAINGDNGYPYAVPINYLYCEEENKIYFHGARVGYKAELIRKDGRVCFTVYGNETVRDEAWAPYVQSVVVFGTCKIIEDCGKAAALVRKFAAKYYPDGDTVEQEVKESGKAVQMYEIEIEYFTGKEIQER